MSAFPVRTGWIFNKESHGPLGWLVFVKTKTEGEGDDKVTLPIKWSFTAIDHMPPDICKVYRAACIGGVYPMWRLPKLRHDPIPTLDELWGYRKPDKDSPSMRDIMKKFLALTPDRVFTRSRQVVNFLKWYVGGVSTAKSFIAEIMGY